MPVIVESNGQNITVLLVLKRLKSDWPFAAGVEVIPQELRINEIRSLNGKR